jgi:hypothetical protein
MLCACTLFEAVQNLKYLALPPSLRWGAGWGAAKHVFDEPPGAQLQGPVRCI